MAKTSDLFRRTGDTMGIFHVRMGMIRNRNIRDLTEAKDTKERWQEYTEELYKTKVLMTQITMVV